MPPYLKYLIILMMPLSAIGQDKQEELIQWNPSYRLTWADYKGKADPSSDAAATTTTYLGIEYNINQNRFTYKIQCRFSRNKSWGIHRTEYILGHEQGHFDIAEIFARILHKEMSEYRFNARTYQQDLKNIYDRLMQAKEDMQNQYDRETNHSINRKKQAEWLLYIDELLEEYADYATYN